MAATSGVSPPPLTLYVAKGVWGNPTQTLFPCICTCANERDFLQATMYDYTNLRFTGGRRDSTNFVGSDCLIGDLDNTHSDISADWLLPEDLAERLHGVLIYYQYSRNHQKIKDGRSPRPKFHFCVPITTVDSPSEYSRQWRMLKAIVPEIDSQTKDLGRFIFGGGVSNTGGSFPGTLTFTDFCEINEIEPVEDEVLSVNTFGFTSNNFVPYKTEYEEFSCDYIIYGGDRNNQLFGFAGKYFTRYRGEQNIDEIVWNKLLCLAYEHCSPPFPIDELRRVFNSAKKYANLNSLKTKIFMPTSMKTTNGMKPMFAITVEETFIKFSVYPKIHLPRIDCRL